MTSQGVLHLCGQARVPALAIFGQVVKLLHMVTILISPTHITSVPGLNMMSGYRG